MPDRNQFEPLIPRQTLPLEDYAAIGDGRSVAIIGLNGAVAWWCVPNLDSEPVFDCILDSAEGGFFTVQPSEQFHADRTYRPNSNVLETTFTTASGIVRVTDSMNSTMAGRLPWCELARRIEVLSGTVTVHIRLTCGTRADTVSPWLEPNSNAAVFHVGGVLGVVRTSSNISMVEVADRDIVAETTLSQGERALVAIVAAENQPLGIPSIEDIDRRIDSSDQAWCVWAAGLQYDGPYRAWVVRSALILKLLLFSPSGAIAAAATTSLPEKIAGKKNYDYRYAWIRDASYTIHAFLGLGQVPESQAAIAWLLQRLAESGSKVCFRLDGRLVPQVQENSLPGYKDSRPVITGNGATAQHQHGVYGDIFEAVALFVASGNVLDQSSMHVLFRLAEECADRWRQPDSGIWELEEQRHYTMSKISVWQALNRAVELAGKGHLPSTCVPRWSRERDRIAAWVNLHCWSEDQAAYTFYPGTDRLDASLVLAVHFGFPEMERLSSTCDAILRKLGCGPRHFPHHGPWIYRYSGAEKEEGAFVACTFWLAEAYATLGRKEDAVKLLDDALSLLPRNLSILSEMIDVKSGGFLGNLPQGLSHLALIHAAMYIHDGPGNLS